MLHYTPASPPHMMGSAGFGFWGFIVGFVGVGVGSVFLFWRFPEMRGKDTNTTETDRHPPLVGCKYRVQQVPSHTAQPYGIRSESC